MSRNKDLAKNTLIIFIGTLCTKMVTFFLLPLYTEILTTEEYGIVDLLNNLIYLLIPIVTFQIEQAVFRDLVESRNNNKKISNIISSSIFMLVFQCILGCIIFLLINKLIDTKYKYYLLFNVLVNIFSSLLLQISRGLGDNKRYSIGSFISATTTIIFNILFLIVIKLRVEGMLLGTIIGQLASFLYLFIFLKLYRYISIKDFNIETAKKLLKYSTPLIPNAISWWVFSSSDKVIVSAILGLSMNGILSVASKFSGIYTILYNIFDKSWIESVVLHIKDRDFVEYFNKTFNILLKLFMSIYLLMVCCMPFVYPIMINESYAYGYNFVPILLLGAFFNAFQGLIVVIYAAKKNTWSIAKTSVVSAILNVIIHLSLIKFIGLYAAAISTLASYLIIGIYRYMYIRKKYFKIKINSSLIANFVVSTIIAFVFYYLNNLVFNIIIFIICVIYIIIINYDSIKYISNFLINKIKKRRKKYEEI